MYQHPPKSPPLISRLIYPEDKSLELVINWAIHVQLKFIFLQLTVKTLKQVHNHINHENFTGLSTHQIQ